MNIVKSFALLSLVLLPHSSYAAFKTYENTWFEIEVILFKQLGDKTQLQEVFPDTSTLPEQENIIDILSPYLAPTLEEVQAALPQCKQFPQYPVVPEDESIPDTTLTTNTDNIDNIEAITTETTQLATTISTDANDLNTASEFINETLIETLNETGTPKQDRYNVNHTFIDLNGPLLLTTYEIQEPVFDAFYSPETFCEVSRFSSPELITGEEDLTTEIPYIINEESLKLHDIMQQLKRSRSFKPLLHTGWRQITRLKSEAIPLKISAGDNLMASYLTAMADYNAALEKQTLEQLIENNTEAPTTDTPIVDINGENSTVVDNQPIEMANRDTQIQIDTVNNEQALMVKLAEIINEAKTQSHDLDTVLSELNNNKEDSQYIASPLNLNGEQKLIAPQLPPQSWSIEGFLKVEVERFLHITADFNVINMSIAEQATQQLANSDPIPLKSIRFEQNKRVRSNEIHYFDHPYMGMIVQIRRHEQATPEPEDVIPVEDAVTTDITTEATQTLKESDQ